jgi:hypothetical protein
MEGTLERGVGADEGPAGVDEIESDSWTISDGILRGCGEVIHTFE